MVVLVRSLLVFLQLVLRYFFALSDNTSFDYISVVACLPLEGFSGKQGVTIQVLLSFLGRLLLNWLMLQLTRKNETLTPSFTVVSETPPSSKNTAGVVFSTLFTAQASPENPSPTVFHKDPYTLFFGSAERVVGSGRFPKMLGVSQVHR